MTEIRLGTIGSGPIVHNILKNVARTEGIRLEAAYSRTAEKAQAIADKYGAKKIYTDTDAFLADEEINFVYIATPNLLHYPQAKKALLAGKNVILEKPFTTKLEHARELVDIAEEKGLILVDAVPTAFLPNLQILKEQLPRIGKLKLVMGNYSQYSSRYDQVLAGEKPNIFNPEYAGGCLMDINFYNVYLNVALFGRPLEAKYYPNLYPGLCDTSGTVIMAYDGFVSQNAGAKDTWGVNFFQIEGEKGYIYIENGPNGIQSVRVVTKDSEELLNAQPDPDRWYYEVQAITRLVLADDRKALRRRLDTMLDVVRTLEESRKNAGIFFPGDGQNA